MENKTIVTDEQVGLLHKTLDIGEGGDIENGSIINFIEAYNESLSTDQLKQLCEAKGLSVVEWVDFDIDDESTWPEIGEDACLRVYNPHDKSYKSGYSTFTTGNGLPRFTYGALCVSSLRVTHWCELPQRKDK